VENWEELQKLKKALQLKQYELRNFLEYARQIIRIFDEERLFKVFLSTAMGQSGITRCILKVSSKNGIFVFSRGIKVPAELEKAIKEERKVLGELLERFGCGKILSLTVVSEMTEMMFKEKGVEHFLSLKGSFIAVPKEEEKKLSPENIEYIKSLYQITLLAYDNILFHRETVERNRLERELEIAREIQQNLLPKEIKIEGFKALGKSIPSRYVGGDYYDFFTLNNGYLVAIGDVAGKGIPAALLMASIQSSLRAIVNFQPSDVAAVIKELNNITIKNTEGQSFITFFIALVNPVSGQIQYCNAGHNPPLLVSKDGVKELTEGGLVLGIMDTAYSSGSEVMRRGDLLFMYTDGLSEATYNGEELGKEKLKQIILNLRDRDPEEIDRYLTEYLRKYYVNDDLTYFILKRLI